MLDKQEDITDRNELIENMNTCRRACLHTCYVYYNRITKHFSFVLRLQNKSNILSIMFLKLILNVTDDDCYIMTYVVYNVRNILNQMK